MPDTELPELPKRKRRGPKRLAALDLRTHTVSVRLNPSELADLDTARRMVQMQRGEYLRAAWMGKLPPTIPPINREAWVHLARVAANLNQRQMQINTGAESDYPPNLIFQLHAHVQQLRAELLGMPGPDVQADHENQINETADLPPLIFDVHGMPSADTEAHDESKN